ncbi:hypothetical protein ACRB68_08420 [Actinomadura sp. RB68]|uniref:ClpX-type ZB domain-containing protein n=2 Tax=Actinomadura macrotermitis TaxID=2585200 RepID=A0A7K0BNV0_9ACTN|nr:hypothetical protein [Actinomadura macrotermitis]
MTYPEDPYCSFCGRPGSEAGKLVDGPGVRICTDCVKLAWSIVDEYTERPADAPPPPWTALDGEQMLARLPQLAAAVDQAEAGLRAWVRELRRRGATWEQIAQALGVTRRSAWERFSEEE